MEEGVLPNERGVRPNGRNPLFTSGFQTGFQAAYIYRDVFPFDGIVLITARIKPRSMLSSPRAPASCLRRLDSALDQYIRRGPPGGAIVDDA